MGVTVSLALGRHGVHLGMTLVMQFDQSFLITRLLIKDNWLLGLVFGAAGGVAVNLVERFGGLSMPGEAWYDGTCFLDTSRATTTTSTTAQPAA